MSSSRKTAGPRGKVGSSQSASRCVYVLRVHLSVLLGVSPWKTCDQICTNSTDQIVYHNSRPDRPTLYCADQQPGSSLGRAALFTTGNCSIDTAEPAGLGQNEALFTTGNCSIDTAEPAGLGQNEALFTTGNCSIDTAEPAGLGQNEFNSVHRETRMISNSHWIVSTVDLHSDLSLYQYILLFGNLCGLIRRGFSIVMTFSKDAKRFVVVKRGVQI
ncbi:hypothetical protein RRG08_002839 [Elysia crispata]|uniref:Uncharacterized protein n=1 Tax=Elysia crispata TaxID=231223 RepID=A0AAE1CMG9_9GAST|nr:hypothetical protein RRG08_002839 [Elysia crispata]